MVFFLQYYRYYVLSISSRNLFLLMMLQINLVFAGPTGLTLKLIHRDSPESPLYPGNLTQLQRMERDFQQSIYHEQQLTAWMKSSWVSRNNNSTNSKSLDTIRPKVSIYGKILYMVQIGIGTVRNPNPPPAPPQIPQPYYLLLDSGSDLLWLQCEGGNENDTFLQNEPLFNGGHSSTYHPLPLNSPDPLCTKYRHFNVGGFCGYRIRYSDGAGSSGILATETLTLDTADGAGSEVIDNFVFGCGLKQIEPALGRRPKGQNPIAGIFGLGGGVGSFVRQLGARGQNRFEYCFKPSYDSNPVSNTFLRFGSDTKIVVGGPGVQTTSIVPTRGETVYYVIMEGISIDGNRVRYPDGSRVFESKQDGTGGCIFDSGAAKTVLSSQAYEPFAYHLSKYISAKYGIQTVPSPPRSPFELCFEWPSWFNTFPVITFHFSGADFSMETGGAFMAISREMFCLNIRQTKEARSYSVIVGAAQQVNRRILHDLEAKKISWVQDNCAVTG